MTQPAVRSLLSGPGNTKLGPLIHSFSLPALTTCPGATAACITACYARRGHFVWPANSRRYQANLRASRRAGFVRRINHELRDQWVRVLRVHVAGDFYDAPYVARWYAIARANPQVQFFAYTRSWRQAALQPLLVQLAGLPNWQLWWSEDRDTAGQAPRLPGIPIAYMCDRPGDEQALPPAATIVFRSHHHRTALGALKRLDGCLVCPEEQLVQARPRPITCARCRLCLTPRWQQLRRRVPPDPSG